jgi:hypothetical protein
MPSWLKRADHFLTRKNRHFPAFLRKGLSQVVFAAVDRRLKARNPDYQQTIFDKLPPISGAWPAAHDGYQIFAVGDAAYMSRYAKYLAVSAVKNCPDAHVHLHLIGSRLEDHSELMELRSSPALAGRLTLSAEAADLAGMDRFLRGRYCQCLRFARCWQLSQACQCPLFVFDLDIIVNADLKETIAGLRDADVGLVVFPKERDPGVRTNAGAVYVAPNEAARDFIRKAAAHMLLHVFHGRFTEKLDQRCLSLAMAQDRSGVRLARLPVGLVGKGDNPPIITGQGVRKDQLLPEIFATLDRQ